MKADMKKKHPADMKRKMPKGKMMRSKTTPMSDDEMKKLMKESSGWGRKSGRY